MYGITKFAMANPGLLKIAMASKELAQKTKSLGDITTSVLKRTKKEVQAQPDSFPKPYPPPLTAPTTASAVNHRDLEPPPHGAAVMDHQASVRF
jgi:hypothetical protein